MEEGSCQQHAHDQKEQGWSNSKEGEGEGGSLQVKQTILQRVE